MARVTHSFFAVMFSSFILPALLAFSLTSPTLALPKFDALQLAPPKTVVIDGSRMLEARARLALGDKKLRKALGALTKEADSWLGKGPWTVVDKPNPPPEGGIHDYLSQAPYW